MILAKINDKEHVISTLEFALKNNPTLLAFSKIIDGKYNIRPILEYAFEYSIVRNGVFLSDDKSCVAFFNPSYTKGNIINLWHLVKLIFIGLKLSHLRTIASHIQNVKKTKPENTKYYHFWFLGGNGSNIKNTTIFINELLEMADLQKLPVFAETTLLKNKIVFKKFGFNTFRIMKNYKLNLTVYLMKRII